jgi:hypothetical protein
MLSLVELVNIFLSTYQKREYIRNGGKQNFQVSKVSKWNTIFIIKYFAILIAGIESPDIFTHAKIKKNFFFKKNK